MSPLDATTGQIPVAIKEREMAITAFVAMSSVRLQDLFFAHTGHISDKWEQYLGIYESELTPIINRGAPVSLLEIGVQNGGSLQIWEKYLPPGSEIFGIDVDPKCARLDLGPNVTVAIADATRKEQLGAALGHRTFDVIVDDGSHLCSDVIQAFRLLFERVRPGGRYLIEDLHCSYWRSYGGGLKEPNASVEWLKHLVDSLNADHFGAESSGTDSSWTSTINREVARISFYDSLAVVEKLGTPKYTPYRRLLSGETGTVADPARWFATRPTAEMATILMGPTTARHIERSLLEEIALLRDEREKERSELASRDEALAEARVALESRDAQIFHLNQAAAERERQIAGLNQAVAERDAHIASLDETVAGRDGRIAHLDRKVDKRDAKITLLERAMTQRDGKIARLIQAVAAREAKLNAMRSSTSWRVTEPIRALRAALARVRPRYRARVLASRTARFVYRRLPLSAPRRLMLKYFVFSSLSRFVRHTGAYQAWVARTEPAPTAAGWPALNPKTSMPVVANTKPGPIPDTPGSAQITDPSPAISEFLFAESSSEHVPITKTPGIHTAVKVIAFYLPQFHPIPENDAWWGKGFTEWTNVTRARPQFVGHYQPHLPGELGFYDLRLLYVQQRQIELARAYGIHGFCYHHYWFAGRRLLDRPFNEVLANKQLDLPFCLCWANENWSRRWDGHDQEILISQQHSPEDDLAFIQDIEPALRDERYIRIRGRPLLIVYRPALLPDAKTTAERWRDYCRTAGIGEIYLASTHAFDSRDPNDIGFDAAIEFPPNNTPAPVVTDQVQILNPAYRGIVHDYRYFLENSRRYVKPPFTLFRCVMPSWDNEARKPSQGITFLHSSPAAYAEWLDDVCRSTTETFSGDERIVFVNAWNEWAEGCHLEPDRRFGYAYLQATRDVLARYPADRSRKIVYVSHDAAYNGAQLLSLHIVKGLCEQLGFQVDVILLAGGPLAPDFARCARVHDFSVAGYTPERQAEVIRELFDSGARAAITSTTVSGVLVGALKRQGFRVVSLVHELPGLIRARKLEDSLENIARFADRVVFPTRGVSEKVCDLSPIFPEKIVIRPQGLLHRNTYRRRTDQARQLVRAEFGLPEKARIVMGMGYGDHRKGVDLFVETAIVTIEKRPDVYFVWVGNCDPELLGPIERKIAERTAGSRILFPGFRPDVDVYLSGADVLLLSSREDPFPSVVLEAMDAGLPVIGFDDAGGFCDLLNEGGGLAVPWGDIAATVTAVERLLDDDLLWQQVSSCAKAMVGDGFRFPDYVYDLASYAGEHCPKVSVIIPNYNYERYLSQRLKSVAGQTYRPYEILFLDDCSTDGSVGVAERILGSSDVPFRVIRNTTNQGTFKQWIRGIREARGDLIWIAEADDFCEERFLEVLVDAFRDPEVELAYSQSRQIDETGRVVAENYLDYTRDISATKWLRPYVRSGIDEIRDTLAIKNTIPNASAVLMRRPDPRKLEAVHSGLSVAGDWLIYVQVLCKGKIAYFPEALNSHRRHRRGVTLASDDLAHLTEIRTAQQLVAARFQVAEAVGAQAACYLQSVYEHFGLHERGPKHFFEHPALQDPGVIGGQRAG